MTSTALLAPLAHTPVSCHARLLPDSRASIRTIMRYPRIRTFSFLIFITSNIIGLQALSLPADAPPSGPPTIMLVSSNETISPSNLAPPKPPVPPRPPPKPPAIVSVKGWAYRGCWTDDPHDRTLDAKRWKGDVTPEKCARHCKGYAFFAVEYSNMVSIFWDGFCPL